MPTTIKLTKNAIDECSVPPPGERVTYHFEGFPALQLRVTSTGVKTFCVYRRLAGGKAERITLGRYPDLSPHGARRMALETLAKLASGTSVAAEKKRAKLEAKSLREAFEDYMARRVLKEQTLFDIRRCMKEVYPDWLDKPMTKVTGDMVVKRHRLHGEEHSEARANLAFRYLRAIFNFAAAEYEDANGDSIIKVNPVKKLSTTKAWHRVERRKTRVESHEIRAWVDAVMALPNEDVRDYLMTLLLTGLRREEALKLTWSDINLVHGTLIVRDPKNRNDHILPLTDYLWDMMTRRKSVSVSDSVFANRLGHRIQNFRYSLAKIEKACGKRITAHDLRRTLASLGGDMEFSPYALKAMLNHSGGADVTLGYVIPELKKMRERMQQITDFVLREAGLKPAADVVELPLAPGGESWAAKQVELIRQGRLGEVDPDTLIRALELLGATKPAEVIRLRAPKR